MKVAWFTSVNIKYMDRAAILARTMKEIHPNWTSYLLLVDDTEKLPQELSIDYDHVINPEDVIEEEPSTWLKVRARDIESRTIATWLAQHNVTEACTAVKPFGMRYLTKEYDYVFYLDPDLAAFNPLDSVLEPLINGASVVLTPHQLEPEEEWQAIVDNEIGTLRTGLYNFGFLGVSSKHPESEKFLNYWAERLKYFCLEDSKSGLHTDQKWGNPVPIFFKDVHITSHPGLNVASWNLSKREFTLAKNGNYLVNQYPLIFYHFSQAKDVGQIMASRYAKGNVLVADMWRWYLEELETYEKLVPEVTWKYAPKQ
jgi:hypothetical protein